jgi:predicted RNase H-like HicB family nuclease
MNSNILSEHAENNRAAYVPDLPGCMTTCKTLEETEINIPTSVAWEIEASAAA